MEGVETRWGTVTVVRSLLLAAAGVLLCCVARAEGPSAEADDSPPLVVLLVPAGEHADQDELAEALAAQLIDVEARFEIERAERLPRDAEERYELVGAVAERTEARVLLWMEPGGEGRIHVHVSEPGGRRVYVETVREAVGAAGAETAALVMRGLVETLVRGGRLGAKPPPAAKKRVEAKGDEPGGQSPSVEPRIGRVELAVGYDLELYEVAPRFVHGLALGAAVRLGGGLWLLAGYRFRPPLTATSSSVRVELSSHPFELGLGFRVGSDRLRLEIALGSLNDPTTWTVRSLDPEVEPRRGRFRWLSGVTARLALLWRAGEVLIPFVSLAADAVLNDGPSTVGRLDGGKEIVIDPLIVRPHLSLGLAFLAG
ncbi:MAG: hypothetical protein R6V85_08080 [Polyangia bacterium]